MFKHRQKLCLKHRKKRKRAKAISKNTGTSGNSHKPCLKHRKKRKQEKAISKSTGTGGNSHKPCLKIQAQAKTETKKYRHRRR